MTGFILLCFYGERKLDNSWCSEGVCSDGETVRNVRRASQIGLDSVSQIAEWGFCLPRGQLLRVLKEVLAFL